MTTDTTVGAAWADLDQAGKDSELVRRYNAKHSFEELAAWMGIDVRGVSRMLHQARDRESLRVGQELDRKKVENAASREAARAEMAQIQAAHGLRASEPSALPEVPLGASVLTPSGRMKSARAINAEEQRELLRRRDAGESHMELSAWMGCSRTAVPPRLLAAAKAHPDLVAELAAAGRAPRYHELKTGSERNAEILRRHREGATLGELVQWSGMSAEAMRAKLRKLLSDLVRDIAADAAANAAPIDKQDLDSTLRPSPARTGAGDAAEPEPKDTSAPAAAPRRRAPRISSADQQLLLQRRFHGETTSQLAAWMGCSLSSVKNRIAAAELAHPALVAELAALSVEDLADTSSDSEPEPASASSLAEELAKAFGFDEVELPMPYLSPEPMNLTPGVSIGFEGGMAPHSVEVSRSRIVIQLEEDS